MNTTYTDLKQIVLPYLQSEHVGFSISGGFDSAVLLWCCCKIKQEEQLPVKFTAYTVKRGDNSATHSANIVRYMRDYFNKDIPHVWVGDPALPHYMQALSGIHEAERLCDYLFIGDTAIPEELVGEWSPKRVRSGNNSFQPFFDWYKDRVVQLAIDLELTDLMMLSHTCTESQDTRCGKCWQCGERIWAFNRCGYTDPGSL